MEATSNTPIKYFRPVRRGPEARLQEAVVHSLEHLASPSPHPRWVAGSLPIGAGMPDVLAISWDPRVVAIADPRVADASILAYLRAVGCARFDTIVSRLGRGAETLSESLDALVQASVILQKSNSFMLDPAWRRILPEVIAIEAKVADWRKAIAQAARNQLFTHRSFVALPHRVAKRAIESETVQQLGLGVLSVDEDGSVAVVRGAVQGTPKIWAYYYQLAHRVALDAPPSTACLTSSR